MQSAPKDLLREYVRSQQFASTADIMQAMKEMFRDVIEQVMEVEMDDELGRERCQRSDEPEGQAKNYRNGYSKKTVKKLAEAIVLTLADFASTLEQLRQKIIILHYNLRHVRKRRSDAEGYLSKAKPMYRDYGELCAKIKEKEQQRHHLEEQIKALPALSVFKRSGLKVKIAELTEDIDALKYERGQIKRGFGKETENDMAAISQQLAGIEANIGKMDKLEARYTGDMAKSKQEFDRLKKQAAVFDLYELTAARLVLRPTMEGEEQERIRSAASDGKISIRSFWMSVSETDKLLYESGMAAWHKEQTQMRQIEQEREQQETKRKTRKHEQGR